MRRELKRLATRNQLHTKDSNEGKEGQKATKHTEDK